MSYLYEGRLTNDTINWKKSHIYTILFLVWAGIIRLCNSMNNLRHGENSYKVNKQSGVVYWTHSFKICYEYLWVGTNRQNVKRTHNMRDDWQTYLKIIIFNPNWKWNYRYVQNFLKDSVSLSLTFKEEGHATHYYQIIKFIKLFWFWLFDYLLF